MKCEVIALADTGGTVPAFWQDSDILTKLVSNLVSTAALSSATHCVPTLWEWSQLPDLTWYHQFRYEENTGFPSEDQEEFGLTRHYFSLLFSIFTDSFTDSARMRIIDSSQCSLGPRALQKQP